MCIYNANHKIHGIFLSGLIIKKLLILHRYEYLLLLRMITFIVDAYLQTFVLPLNNFYKFIYCNLFVYMFICWNEINIFIYCIVLILKCLYKYKLFNS